MLAALDESRDELAGGSVGVEEDADVEAVDEVAPSFHSVFEECIPGVDGHEEAVLASHVVADEDHVDPLGGAREESFHHFLVGSLLSWALPSITKVG